MLILIKQLKCSCINTKVKKNIAQTTVYVIGFISLTRHKQSIMQKLLNKGASNASDKN
jgi:hypothetical protein